MGVETQTTRQKVSALAWAGFQVLASRCVKWEVEDGTQKDLFLVNLFIVFKSDYSPFIFNIYLIYFLNIFLQYRVVR